MGEEKTYNLEIFEVFVFSVPELKKTLPILFSLPLIFGISLKLLNSAGAAFQDTQIAIFCLSLLIASILGSEFTSILVPDFRRSWSYFLMLVNSFLFIFLSYSFMILDILTVPDILWLSAGVVLLNSFEVLTISTSFNGTSRKVIASSAAPAVIISGALHQVLILPEISKAFLLLSSVMLVIASAKFCEWLNSVNSDVSGFEFTSALTLSEPLSVGLGKKVRRPVQSFEINSGNDSITFLAPWFHPGLIDKIGGGRLSTRTIERLNDREKGFFLHVPTTHKSDPTDPEDVDKIISNREGVDERAGEASEMVVAKHEKYSLFGRKYGDKKAVFIRSSGYDDIEIDVYRDIIDPENEILVDCHGEPGDIESTLRSETPEAENFRDNLKEILERLEKVETREYSAGFSLSKGKLPLFALVESIEEQKTLIIGFDGNDSHNKERFRSKFDDRFDEVLIPTTDTHRNPRDLNREPEKKKLTKTVEKAEERLSEAEAGLKSVRSPRVSTLGDHYPKILGSFNITARLFILSLAGIYIYLLTGTILL